MTIRRRKRIRFLAILLAAGVAGFLGRDFYGRHKVAVLRAELRARGERLALEEIVEGFSPEAYQTGEDLIKLGEGLPQGFARPRAMAWIAPGKAEIGSAKPDVWDPNENVTHTWDEVERDLAAFRPALLVAQVALQRKPVACRLDYARGFEILLPGVSQAKGFSRRFLCAAMEGLHRGDLPVAMTNLLASWTTPHALENDHLVMSELVRMAISEESAAVVWEMIHSPGCGEAELAQIAAVASQLDYAAPMVRAPEMERAMALAIFDRVHGWKSGWAGPLEWPFGADLNSAAEQAVLRAFFLGWKWVWSRGDEYRFLNLIQEVLDVSRELRASGNYSACRNRMRELDRQISELRGVRHLFTHSLITMERNCPERIALAETGKQLLLTAIAIRRHELRHCRQPETLARLVPKYLSELPRDWMNGESLHYRPGTNGNFQL
ncbi:MAG TPA: hypothetical protein VHH73_18100, partial [Verrucomicrobiae bacterium]|nr:hypothetical protein [Verrucomicrobiae bacterium]